MKWILGIILSVGICSNAIVAGNPKSSLVTTRFILQTEVTTANMKVLSNKLIKVTGIKHIEPTLSDHSVKITYNSKQVTLPDVGDALQKSGYPATVAPENQLKVSNFSIRSL